jgi:hypothetical protein
MLGLQTGLWISLRTFELRIHNELRNISVKSREKLVEIDYKACQPVSSSIAVWASSQQNFGL